MIELSALRRAARRAHKANPADVRRDIYGAAIEHARNRHDAAVAALVARMNATELWLFLGQLHAASHDLRAAISGRLDALQADGSDPIQPAGGGGQKSQAPANALPRPHPSFNETRGNLKKENQA
jgi:hypothetical protein